MSIPSLMMLGLMALQSSKHPEDEQGMRPCQAYPRKNEEPFSDLALAHLQPGCCCNCYCSWKKSLIFDAPPSTRRPFAICFCHFSCLFAHLASFLWFYIFS